jgi:hypothetical protein
MAKVLKLDEIESFLKNYQETDIILGFKDGMYLSDYLKILNELVKSNSVKMTMASCYKKAAEIYRIKCGFAKLVRYELKLADTDREFVVKEVYWATSFGLVAKHFFREYHQNFECSDWKLVNQYGNVIFLKDFK